MLSQSRFFVNAQSAQAAAPSAKQFAPAAHAPKKSEKTVRPSEVIQAILKSQNPNVALSDCNAPTAIALARAIAKQNHTRPLSDRPWLIGSDGCSLCQKAHDVYRLAQTAADLPNAQSVEVLDFQEPLLSLFAPRIPVLFAKTALLVYPFGLLDIVGLENR